ncbi:hypothetical protein DXG01_015618 [Tephrocybe rancida]|nr:hypothetical protein DXG01_015618 [Tephrocybe rancida]
MSFRTIIICRFLLMLRAIYYNDAPDDEAETQVWSLRFASSVIGPLGTTIEPHANHDDAEAGLEGKASSSDAVVFSRDPFFASMVAETSTMSTTATREKEEDLEGSEVETPTVYHVSSTSSWSV